MMNRQGFAVVLLAMWGAGFPASAQQTNAPTGQETSVLTGKITFQSGEPVPGARVTLSPGGAKATTDEEGNFRIDAPPGKYTMDASFEGIASAKKENVQLGATPTNVVLALTDESFSD